MVVASHNFAHFVKQNFVLAFYLNEVRGRHAVATLVTFNYFEALARGVFLGAPAVDDSLLNFGD